MPLHLSLAAVPLLIALNAFFVVSEYAVVAARPAQVQSLRARGRLRSAAAVEQLRSDPTSAIGAIQVCITMTNLLLGWIGEPAMSNVLHMLFGPLIRLWPALFGSISTLLSFIVVTLLTVVFSELLPKAMTLRYVEAAATISAVPVLAIQRAIFPLVWIMNKTANLVTVPLGLGRVEQFGGEDRTSLEELRLLANRAADEGVVTARQRAVMLGSLSIGRRRASEVMVPRVRTTFLDLHQSMESNRRIVGQRLFSRLPLCDGSMDKVIGIVHSKEFLTAYPEASPEGDSSVLLLIARQAVFVPENITLDRLLETFHRARTEMVVLVDEYGGVEGMVTLKDVVDELVGEIPEDRGPARSQ
jgi:CBS domain containing-hemolysin-like protein